MEKKHVVLFLAITFGWSWGFWALPVLAHRGVVLPTLLAGFSDGASPAAWGPLVGAISVALMRGGVAGVKALFARAFRFRIGWNWAFVVLFTFPFMIGGSVLVAWLCGETLMLSEPMRQPVMILIGVFVILFNGGPLQEEFGWRGTLLDPLQARFGALGASLAVGAIWGLWHLPLFQFPNDAGPYYGRPFWGLLLTCMLISVLFTWIWNNTGGAMLAMLVFHTMFNLSHWVFPSLESDLAGLVLFGLQFALVAIVIVRFGPRYLRRGGRSIAHAL